MLTEDVARFTRRLTVRPLPLVVRCQESFSLMRGDDRTRRCERCGVDVHDLSARTEKEARELLASENPPRCVRFAVDRSTGKVRFRAAVVGAVAMSVAASSVALASGPTEAVRQPPQADAGGDASTDVDHWMGR